MLAYLDALITALTARNAEDIERLLAHPLARILPPEARREAEAFRRGECDDYAAPLRVMQARHQTAELLREGLDDAAREEASKGLRVANGPPWWQRHARSAQIEFPLSA